LLRAFEKVRQTLPEAELVLVGPHFPDFRFERARWKGAYRHFENIPRSELAQLLRSSTAFVFPSNEEGFAKAIIEAMACGLPIIATHQSGATTLVEDGVQGYIVRERDVDQLADRMLKLALDRPANERMGEAAYARGAVGNTWEDFARRTIQRCETALGQRKCPAASPRE
jgi:glycosyltransferase involved in cell wall biosynthesis